MHEQTEPASAQSEIADLSERLTKLENSVSSLVKAWNAAGTLVTAVKWAATIGAALTVIWTALKTNLLTGGPHP